MTTAAGPDTNDAVEDAPVSGTVRAVVYISYLCALALVFAAAVEIILRVRGFQPLRAENPTVSAIRVDPGGRFFQKHPVLGYSHMPGRFAVTLPNPLAEQRGDSLRFTVTHLADTLRTTRPLESYNGAGEQEEIWIFGCSLTHGWSVNDDETYPWLLQERFPDYEVVNFGVSGYGTIHSLLQFREALKSRTPRVVVLAFADFHDERNTFARTRRKDVAPWNRLGPLVQPYARLDATGGLRYFMADVEYQEFPLMRHLSVAHYIELRYNLLEAEWIRSREVSEALVMEMATLAKQRQVPFLVASIGGPARLPRLEQAGVPFVDISVDSTRPENTNRPYDPHPSAFAHAQYARKLEPLVADAVRATP